MVHLSKVIWQHTAMMLSEKLTAKTSQIKELLFELNEQKTIADKINYLEGSFAFRAFTKKNPQAAPLLQKLNKHEREVISAIIAAGFGEALFKGAGTLENPLSKLKALAKTLKISEKFYKPLGGLLGCYEASLKLLQKKRGSFSRELILKPPGLALKENDPHIKKFIRTGLEHTPEIGEVYPLGGAADRLNLKDEASGEPLPQAKLIFQSRTLLEGLIRDIKGIEHLYCNLFHKKVTTPIAIMTSQDKNNTQHILEILQEKKWFGRTKECFFLFEQPLIPMITEEGDLAITNTFEIAMKPGGHGVIWEIMKIYGVFDWFQEKGCKFLTIRQINNPLSAIDMNLLALRGQGIEQKKSFGFLTCERRLKAPEGMNVLVTSRNEDGFSSSITNIEYTDFEEKGIKDIPESQGSPYSLFPANTNILFAKISGIKKALHKLPFPGLIMNVKNKITIRNEQGEPIETRAGRLECTMQNIADAMVLLSQAPLEPQDYSKLETFVLYNRRLKTISVTKKEWKEGEPTYDTPHGAFLDKLKNAWDIFTEAGFKLPLLKEDYPPSCLLDYNPALGPLYSIIRQKLRGGEIIEGSEWIMDSAEADIENLKLEGSLHIIAPEGKIHLKNCFIKNKGLEPAAHHSFWKGDLKREECLTIKIGDKGEFFAENMSFLKGGLYEVPPGHKMTISQVNGHLTSKLSPLSHSSWEWDYQFADDHSIVLTFKEA